MYLICLYIIPFLDVFFQLIYDYFKFNLICNRIMKKNKKLNNILKSANLFEIYIYQIQCLPVILHLFPHCFVYQTLFNVKLRRSCFQWRLLHQLRLCWSAVCGFGVLSVYGKKILAYSLFLQKMNMLHISSLPII